ncbi:hypothetical protein CYMTET_16419 [Cymbomonas tetramitiformis]|uniref:Chlorophyll a-b binding protein, chloroplastic n=1 Tax=Cymbomonas tetramitiformis TaxID=36881 RepID=A0AAE0GCM4_9CHLO|nr:hypothetical protein CYMTET_16419 [Cymbomonas tetramitiformis]|eukprot:gene13714-16207_t
MFATRAATSLRADVSKSSFAGKAMPAAAARPQAMRSMKVVAEAKPHWCPGNSSPAHLDGSLVGDFGFDPLGLGKDPADLKWYVQAELVHARFAMLGLAGMVVPEVWTLAGVWEAPVWFEAGKYDYGVNFATIFTCQIILMGWAETRRYMDYKNDFTLWESQGFGGSGLNGYPGSIFDPFGYSKDAKKFEANKLKEIKNGRLAMMACLGCYGQAAATGKGPVACWLEHIADPFHTTVASNAAAVPFL